MTKKRVLHVIRHTNGGGIPQITGKVYQKFSGNIPIESCPQEVLGILSAPESRTVLILSEGEYGSYWDMFQVIGPKNENTVSVLNVPCEG